MTKKEFTNTLLEGKGVLVYNNDIDILTIIRLNSYIVFETDGKVNSIPGLYNFSSIYNSILKFKTMSIIGIIDL